MNRHERLMKFIWPWRGLSNREEIDLNLRIATFNLKAVIVLLVIRIALEIFRK